jgi:hypothetical protein
MLAAETREPEERRLVVRSRRGCRFRRVHRLGHFRRPHAEAPFPSCRGDEETNFGRLEREPVTTCSAA